MIPQRNLSLLSNRLAEAGGRRIPEEVLERDYCLSWILVGLSRSPLRDLLAFKGGTALKKCYFPDYRFSEDLDFTLLDEQPWERIKEGLEPVFKSVRESSGIEIAFDRKDEGHENSHTFYLSYTGPLPKQRPKTVKSDITIREKVVFPLQEIPVLRGCKEYADLPEDGVLKVYSLDEIAAEKAVALGDPARNEPRDLYDLWHLTEGAHVRLDELAGAVREKLAFRGSTPERASEAFKAKEARLGKLWEVRLGRQLSKLPEFEETYRRVRRAVRQAGLFGGAE